MKLIRIITVILLVLSLAFWGGSALLRTARADNTIPKITCPQDPLVISVSDSSSEVLCRDVSAYDEKDKDLTDKIVTSISLQSNGTGVITYSVSDSNNHVVSVERPLVYSDYHAPRFSLTRDLRYTLGSTLRITDRLFASDLLDGDLSNQIKVTANELDPDTPGTYPVTFQVSNSTGDITAVTLDVVITSYTSALPSINLSEYLVYPDSPESFDPQSYLIGTSYCGDSPEVDITVPDFVTGMNRVLFATTAADGSTITTTLYVFFDEGVLE